jgi:anti-anti-sigma regulatory factor
MPTRITQIDDPEATRIILKVEGSLYLEDAELIAGLCSDLTTVDNKALTLDLSELDFLDSDGAAILCRLKREKNLALEGLHLFIQKIIELSEQEN